MKLVASSVLLTEVLITWCLSFSPVKVPASTSDLTLAKSLLSLLWKDNQRVCSPFRLLLREPKALLVFPVSLSLQRRVDDLPFTSTINLWNIQQNAWRFNAELATRGPANADVSRTWIAGIVPISVPNRVDQFVVPGLGASAKLLLDLDLRGLLPNTAVDDSARIITSPHTAVLHINTSAGERESRDVYITATVMPGRSVAPKCRVVLPSGDSAPRAEEDWEIIVQSRDMLGYSNEAMDDGDQFVISWLCEEGLPPETHGNHTKNPCHLPSAPLWGSGVALTNYDSERGRYIASVTMPAMGWYTIRVTLNDEDVRGSPTVAWVEPVQCGPNAMPDLETGRRCICIAGHAGDGTYATQNAPCTACAAGRFALTPERLNCRNCASFGDGVNKYSPVATDSGCLTCAPGSVSLPGGLGCQTCRNGTVQIGTDCVSCTTVRGPLSTSTRGAVSANACMCLEDTFLNTGGRCERCDAGFEPVRLPGETVPRCVPCGPRMYKPHESLDSCEICPDGTISEMYEGSKECIACGFGTFVEPVLQNSNNTKNTSQSDVSSNLASLPLEVLHEQHNICQQCPQGTFADTLQSTRCKVCEPGRITVSPGSHECSSCMPGRVNLGQNNSNACTPCRPGTNSSRVGGTFCGLCPKGLISGVGAAMCTACSPGEYASYSKSNDTTVCDKCPAGTFSSSPGFGMDSCKVCPAGTRANLPVAASECWPCPAGSFSHKDGLTSCVPCPAGFFASEPGTIQCGACVAGRRAGSRRGATFCAECDVGSVCPRASTIQRACPENALAPDFEVCACNYGYFGMRWNDTSSLAPVVAPSDSIFGPGDDGGDVPDPDLRCFLSFEGLSIKQREGVIGVNVHELNPSKRLQLEPGFWQRRSVFIAALDMMLRLADGKIGDINAELATYKASGDFRRHDSSVMPSNHALLVEPCPVRWLSTGEVFGTTNATPSPGSYAHCAPGIEDTSDTSSFRNLSNACRGGHYWECCPKGYLAPACSVCDVQAGFVMRSGRCVVCNPISESLPAKLLSFFGTLLALVVLGFAAQRCRRNVVRQQEQRDMMKTFREMGIEVGPKVTLKEDSDTRKLDEKVNRSSTMMKIKIFVGLGQILASFREQIPNVAWPPLLENLMTLLQSFNLDFVQFLDIDCAYSKMSFEIKFLVQTVAPILVLGIMFIAYVIVCNLRANGYRVVASSDHPPTAVSATEGSVDSSEESYFVTLEAATNIVLANVKIGKQSDPDDEPVAVGGHSILNATTDGVTVRAVLRVDEAGVRWRKRQRIGVSREVVIAGSGLHNISWAGERIVLTAPKGLSCPELSVRIIAEDHVRNAHFVLGDVYLSFPRNSHGIASIDEGDVDLTTANVAYDADAIAHITTGKDGTGSAVQRFTFRPGKGCQPCNPNPDVQPPEISLSWNKASSVNEVLGENDSEGPVDTTARARLRSAVGRISTLAYLKGLAEYRLQQDIRRIQGLFQNAALLLLFLVFPSACSMVFAVLRTCRATLDGTSWLQADLSQSCDENGFSTIYAMAWLMLIVYPIGIPLGTYFMLRSKRGTGHGKLFVLDDSNETVLNPEMHAKLGFLYFMYKPQHWYFDTVDLYRKLFFTALVTYVRPGSTAQLVVALLVASFFITVYAYVKPFHRHVDNVAMLTSNVLVYLVLLLALVSKFSDGGSKEQQYSVFGSSLVVLFWAQLVGLLCFTFHAQFEPARRLLREYNAAHPGHEVGFWSFMMRGKVLFDIEKLQLKHVPTKHTEQIAEMLELQGQWDDVSRQEKVVCDRLKLVVSAQFAFVQLLFHPSAPWVSGDDALTREQLMKIHADVMDALNAAIRCLRDGALVECHDAKIGLFLHAKIHTVRQRLKIARAACGSEQRVGVRFRNAAVLATEDGVGSDDIPEGFDFGEIADEELHGSSVGSAIKFNAESPNGIAAGDGASHGKQLWNHFKTSDLRTLAQHRAEVVFNPIQTDKGLGKEHYTNVIATHYLRALRGNAVVCDAARERKHEGAAVAKRQFLRIAEEIEDTIRHMSAMVRRAKRAGGSQRTRTHRVLPGVSSTAEKYVAEDEPVVKERKRRTVPQPTEEELAREKYLDELRAAHQAQSKLVMDQKTEIQRRRIETKERRERTTMLRNHLAASEALVRGPPPNAAAPKPVAYAAQLAILKEPQLTLPTGVGSHIGKTMTEKHQKMIELKAHLVAADKALDGKLGSAAKPWMNGTGPKLPALQPLLPIDVKHAHKRGEDQGASGS